MKVRALCSPIRACIGAARRGDQFCSVHGRNIGDRPKAAGILQPLLHGAATTSPDNSCGQMRQCCRSSSMKITLPKAFYMMSECGCAPFLTQAPAFSSRMHIASNDRQNDGLSMSASRLNLLRSRETQSEARRGERSHGLRKGNLCRASASRRDG
jgi:hypothetical protein